MTETRTLRTVRAYVSHGLPLADLVGDTPGSVPPEVFRVWDAEVRFRDSGGYEDPGFVSGLAGDILDSGVSWSDAREYLGPGLRSRVWAEYRKQDLRAGDVVLLARFLDLRAAGVPWKQLKYRWSGSRRHDVRKLWDRAQPPVQPPAPGVRRPVA